jgi:adenylyltransferase/sulfurtransferase
MARVTARLPRMLGELVGGRSVSLEATTVGGALEELFRLHPQLRVHIFDEDGALRTHVMCFHNDADVRRAERREAPLRDGDEIAVLQAVSGGSSSA